MESIDLHLGICALCLKPASLQDSHLTPRWVYKRLRNASNGKDDPVCIASGSAFLTSKQTKKHLLCTDCEERFQKREDYVARLTDSGMKKFLDHITPLDQPLAGAVELDTARIDIQKLSYFAISIIWRSCFIEGGCTLGKYQEQFRKYLLEEDEFPQFSVLTMTIIKISEEPNDDLYNMYTQPSSGRTDDGLWFHGFSLFGLMFRCFVGKAIEPEWKAQLCLAGPGKRKYALLQAAGQCADHQVAARTFMAAKPRGKLLMIKR